MKRVLNVFLAGLVICLIAGEIAAILRDWWLS